MFDLQVLKEWNDIETVLIDDFQETGNEQVLFVPHNFTISESKDLNIIGHVRYINIRAWLRGFQVKIANFSSFLCPSIPKRDLDTKKTTPNIEV